MRGSIFMRPSIFRMKAAVAASIIRNKMALLLSMLNLLVMDSGLVYVYVNVYAKIGGLFRDNFVKR